MDMATKAKSDNVVRFAFLNETKGALRFQEVGVDGKEVPADKQRIGSLYFRKAQFGAMTAQWASEGTPPALLSITVECADK
jgi:hypothetical protein